jgi:uncharacterized protein YqjF (DUF2071 family)
MRQRWASLLFLHWEVPADDLRRVVPPGLEVDTFEGRAFVGLVPFTMTGIRPPGLPAIPWLSQSHEVNARTYVHRDGRDPGVWFFSLDANHSLAVRTARAFFYLPYYRARIRLDRDASGAIDYASERLWPPPTPATCAVRYRPTGRPAAAQVGALEHFLVERYILYAYRDGRLYFGRVHHAPYPVQGAEVHAWDETLTAAAGVRRPETPPLAHYAEEVRVRIYPLRRVEA